MDSYSAFAYVYDSFMENVPYDKWKKNLIELLAKNGVSEGLVCELGCGTGQMTRRLSDAGFDMIGIDMSYDMLMEAMNAESEMALDDENGDDKDEEHVDALYVDSDQADTPILYLCQDMRSFELYGTVAAIVSVCDSMNYLTSYDDLITVFELANNYLDPGGVFIFDMNTIFKYETLMADNVIAENGEDASFIWENDYDKESRNNTYNLTLYIKNEDDDYYERFEECHIQHAFSIDEVKAAADKAGMRYIDVLDTDTMGPVTETTERIYFILGENGK